MDQETRINSIADIMYEIDGIHKAERGIAEFFAGAPAATRSEGSYESIFGFRGVFMPDTGRRLIAACSHTTRRRYETLLYFEAQFPQNMDYSVLIGPACQIIETELDTLVASPARTIADSLIKAIHIKPKDGHLAEILTKWADGSVPTTLGTISLILMALRRGTQQNSTPILEFLNDHFKPTYLPKLRSKRLESSLSSLRERFRNPASHGTASFDAAQYLAFVQLTVANRRYEIWDLQGPEEAEPGPDIGLFHHHLYDARRPVQELPDDLNPAMGTALDSLLQLRSSPASTLKLHFAPHDVAATRDITVSAVSATPAFHLGAEIRFAFSANTDCYVTLLDIGTSGNVAMVLPNAWEADTRVIGGRQYLLPDPALPRFVFRLAPPPGVERVVAIATQTPLAVPPPEGAPFRKLDADAIHSIVAMLSNLDPSAWTITHCAFTIDP